MCAGMHAPAAWLGEQRASHGQAVTAKPVAPFGMGRVCPASWASGSSPLEQAGASQVQSHIWRALQTPRAEPWPYQTTSLNPQVS